MKRLILPAMLAVMFPVSAVADTAELTQALRSRAAGALGIDTADVAIVLPAVPELEQSVEAYTFRFASIPRGRVVVKAATPLGRNTSFSVDIRTWGDVLVAAGAIDRLAPLQPSQFTTARRDITQLAPVPAVELTGMRTRTRIAAGAVLTRDRVEPIPPVDRGASVCIKTTRGTVRVTRTGTALSDAQLGEFVRVRVSNRKVIQAKVTGPNECVIGS